MGIKPVCLNKEKKEEEVVEIKDPFYHKGNNTINEYGNGIVRITENLNDTEKPVFTVNEEIINYDCENNIITYNDSIIELPENDTEIFDFLINSKLFDNYDGGARFFIVDILTTRIVFLLRARVLDKHISPEIIRNTMIRNEIASILYFNKKYKEGCKELEEKLIVDMDAFSSIAPENVMTRLEKVFSEDSKLNQGMLEMEYQIYR